jgi:hypothetical protein
MIVLATKMCTFVALFIHLYCLSSFKCAFFFFMKLILLLLYTIQVSLFTNPIWLVKTRLQLQTAKHHSSQYSGFSGNMCFL